MRWRRARNGPAHGGQSIYGRWLSLALVSPGQIEDEVVKRLVRDYCFDFITLPIPSDPIVGAVGHPYGMVALRGIAGKRGRPRGDVGGHCGARVAPASSVGQV